MYIFKIIYIYMVYVCVCNKIRTGIRLYTVYNVETFVAKATEKLLYQVLTLLQQVGEKPPMILVMENSQQRTMPNPRVCPIQME